MARKSFKKGVKSIIDSIDNDNKKASTKKQPASKPKAKLATPKKKANESILNDYEFNLGSRFVVQEVDSAMNTFKEVLSKSGRVLITSDEVTEMDVSYIQMIVAFEKAAKGKNLKVNWQLKFSDDIMKTMINTGLTDILKPFIDESMAEIFTNG